MLFYLQATDVVTNIQLVVVLSSPVRSPPGTFSQPLRPSEHYELEQQFGFHSAITPRGPELTADIASTLYGIWKDTANVEIRSPMQRSKPPFPNFRWTVTLKLLPGAALTPLKVGIVTCWMMKSLIQWKKVSKQDLWPGYLQAKIFERTPQGLVEVGSIDIQNLGTSTSTSTSDLDPVSSPNSNSSSVGGLSNIPSDKEDRWLQCFSLFYWGILTQSYSDPLRDNPYMKLPQPGRMNVNHRPCGDRNLPPLNVNDKLDLTLDSEARQLTWDRLAKELVQWLNAVASRRFPYPYNVAWRIRDGDLVYATLRIKFG
ncbi:MAG: hypothetical protein L6R40_002621 [Gallowayella cf. fulva]|nr:MAG: hypothetical protein L6R40_002621 [Xanthomendoza cf. fulva]